MERVQDKLVFPIDTPSDEDLIELFSEEDKHEKRAADLLDAMPHKEPPPRPSLGRIRDTKKTSTFAQRKKKRKAAKRARRAARA